MKTIKAFLYFIPILSVISCSKDMLSGEELKNTDKSDNIFKTEFRIGFEPGYEITTKTATETISVMKHGQILTVWTCPR